MNIPVRDVPLDRQGRHLKFDVARSIVRMAYWVPEIAGGRQVGEQRVSAVQRKTLREALQVVLGEADADFDVPTVEAYIRGLPGGRELP